VGSNSSSYYRSSYLDSSPSNNSYSSTYSYPSYESRYQALLNRNPDGAGKSRSGTSTKYDYLSSYASNSSSQDKTPYYRTTSYASVIDTDELTKNYFEKYYNKPSTTGYSLLEREINVSASNPRSSRAFSVYLDEERSGTSRTSALSENRTARSSSVAVAADPTPSRNSESFRRRFSRTLSVYDDNDSGSPIKTNGVTTNGVTAGHEEDSSEYKYTSGYVRFSDRKKAKEKEREDSPPSTSSYYKRALDNNSNYGNFRRESPTATNSNQRAYGGRSSYSVNGEEENSRFSSGTSSYTKHNGYHHEDSPEETKSEASQTGSNLGSNGLRNIGNTCFMNSVIQCLSNTKLLTNYLLSDEHVREINSTSSSMKGSLVKAFATVIKGLWKVNGRVVDPSSLKGAIQRFAPRFSGYNQEDSQEFLRYLLEGLHEDVNRVATRPAPIDTEIDSSLSVCEQAMEAWKRYIRRDDSHLVDLFVGQLKSTLRCTHCNHESVTFEPFWDLSLGIPARTGDVSLNECFDAFTKEETLDGDEMPTCESCKTRRKSTKRYSLYRLPKILVVHLKRFSPTERFRQKLSSTVTFPLTGLSLARYTDSVTSSSYNCYAISNHSGTLYSGHYTAYAKHPHNGHWQLFNDSKVSKCSSSNVISNEAYLLFFELS